jgi:hypothetical protein
MSTKFLLMIVISSLAYLELVMDLKVGFLKINTPADGHKSRFCDFKPGTQLVLRGGGKSTPHIKKDTTDRSKGGIQIKEDLPPKIQNKKRSKVRGSKKESDKREERRKAKVLRRQQVKALRRPQQVLANSTRQKQTAASGIAKSRRGATSSSPTGTNTAKTLPRTPGKPPSPAPASGQASGPAGNSTGGPRRGAHPPPPPPASEAVLRPFWDPAGRGRDLVSLSAAQRRHAEDRLLRALTALPANGTAAASGGGGGGGRHPELGYALSRLVRGLSSPRGAAGEGFRSALARVLREVGPAVAPASEVGGPCRMSWAHPPLPSTDRGGQGRKPGGNPLQ